jgi:tetratricopeptide (TPR) repeat protein
LQNLVTGQAQAAAADFDAVLSQDGADAAALSGRGMANSVLGKAAEAVADFNHALALDPGYVRGYLSRATLSLERGNFAEANADFDAALRLHHGDREALAGRVLADSRQLPVAAETTASTTKMTWPWKPLRLKMKMPHHSPWHNPLCTGPFDG